VTDLTPRQQQMLTFIIDCWDAGWLPTFAELAKHMGTKYPTTHSMVNILRHKGFLRNESRIGLAEHVAKSPNNYV
jgi:Mn-dependent DtxR family transcriptional regulator